MSARQKFVVALVAVAVITPVVSAAQTTAPRTPWGDPDLGGVWDFRTLTPLERPEAQADREFLTEEEVAEIERGAEQTNRTADAAEAVRTEAGGNVGAYNRFWLDFGTNVVEDGRTSLIVDPPNGRRPPKTPEGESATWVRGGRSGRGRSSRSRISTTSTGASVAPRSRSTPRRTTTTSSSSRRLTTWRCSSR